MVGKSKNPTKAEKRRWEMIVLGGCVACLQREIFNDQVQIHHLLKGYRRGHSYTIGLCAYHHQGYIPEGLTKEQAKEIVGPSLALQKKAFHEEFGDDDFLLELQNKIVNKVEDSIV